MIRLDKFFTETATLTRSVANVAIKSGQVKVNGTVIKQPDFKINPEIDEIFYLDNKITYSKYVYIILNKPEGVVSATEDTKQKTVLDLLDNKYKKMGLFPCGRLDKDTLGLVLLTNHGALAHNLLSPKHHVSKKYKYKCIEPLNNSSKESLSKSCEIRVLAFILK